MATKQQLLDILDRIENKGWDSEEINQIADAITATPTATQIAGMLRAAELVGRVTMHTGKEISELTITLGLLAKSVRTLYPSLADDIMKIFDGKE